MNISVGLAFSDMSLILISVFSGLRTQLTLSPFKTFLYRYIYLTVFGCQDFCLLLQIFRQRISKSSLPHLVYDISHLVITQFGSSIHTIKFNYLYSFFTLHRSSEKLTLKSPYIPYLGNILHFAPSIQLLLLQQASVPLSAGSSWLLIEQKKRLCIHLKRQQHSQLLSLDLRNCLRFQAV